VSGGSSGTTSGGSPGTRTGAPPPPGPGPHPSTLTEWPPTKPTGPKPPRDTQAGSDWRYQRYRYERRGKSESEVLSYEEWYKRYYEQVLKGNRPGRRGGPTQAAAKQQLAGEGVTLSENTELGGRYPDGFKPNERGGTDYYQVGKMRKDGKPYARETKLYDELKALGPNDRVIFVDEADTSRRAVYDYGADPAKVNGPVKR